MKEAVKVGLQLLLVQPSDTAVLALRAACLAAGTAYPAYAGYKAAKPEASPKAKDAVLRLVAASGAFELAERGLLAPLGLTRWRYWPTAKLAFLLWLLLDGGKGADRVYARMCRLLRPYEREIDDALAAAAPLVALAGHTFLSPLKTAACSCAAVCLAGWRLARMHLQRQQEQQEQEQQQAGERRRQQIAACQQRHQPGVGLAPQAQQLQQQQGWVWQAVQQGLWQEQAGSGGGGGGASSDDPGWD